MKRRKINLAGGMQAAIFATLVIGFTALLLPGVVFADSYVGSDTCQACHEKQYNQWTASGHPYKLMKGEEAKNRPIPLPQGFVWDDISYVIGGYKWKSRYMDSDGYIITTTFDRVGNPMPGVNQYNYLTGQWSNYHAGEENKPYDCGSCHTTGWVADADATTDNDLSDNQDGLPGIHGTFEFGGVHCEACHGPGNEMSIDDSAAFCGTCHIRGDQDTIPASGGFIRHHEQYNEFLAGPHARMSCNTCHDPHVRGEFSITRECNVCHRDIAESYATTTMADYEVECEDCHMPYATKSAQALGVGEGDLQTHIFYIDTDPNANMFTADGKFVNLDDNGKAAVTMDFACKRCHETAELTELAKFAKNFHDQTLDAIGLNPGLTGNWRGGSDRDGEGFSVEIGSSNGKLALISQFYTYDNFGNQVWLLATGPIATGTSVTVDVFITEGPMWGSDFDPVAVDTIEWGSATFTFLSCSAGSVALKPNQAMKNQGFSDIGYDLRRDLMKSVIQCPTFVNNAQ